jgi:hypothetical protein
MIQPETYLAVFISKNNNEVEVDGNEKMACSRAVGNVGYRMYFCRTSRYKPERSTTSDHAAG